MTTERMVRQDALPENIRFSTPCHHYNECGCEVSSCCIECPLPVCKYELTNGMQSVRGILKTLRIKHLLAEGRSVDWIAQVLGISKRTVYRAQVAETSVIASLTDTTRRATMSIAAQ